MSDAALHAPLEAERNGTMVLVACASRKRPIACRAFARRRGERWFILSARHGLLELEAVTAPYDQTLTRMAAEERRRWAAGVAREIDTRVAPGMRLVILAGRAYREHLEPQLAALGYPVEVPLRGIGIGQQLRALASLCGDRPA